MYELALIAAGLGPVLGILYVLGLLVRLGAYLLGIELPSLEREGPDAGAGAVQTDLEGLEYQTSSVSCLGILYFDADYKTLGRTEWESGRHTILSASAVDYFTGREGAWLSDAMRESPF